MTTEYHLNPAIDKFAEDARFNGADVLTYFKPLITKQIR